MKKFNSESGAQHRRLETECTLPRLEIQIPSFFKSESYEDPKRWITSHYRDTPTETTGRISQNGHTPSRLSLTAKAVQSPTHHSLDKREWNSSCATSPQSSATPTSPPPILPPPKYSFTPSAITFSEWMYLTPLISPDYDPVLLLENDLYLYNEQWLRKAPRYERRCFQAAREKIEKELLKYWNFIPQVHGTQQPFDFKTWEARDIDHEKDKWEAYKLRREAKGKAGEPMRWEEWEMNRHREVPEAYIKYLEEEGAEGEVQRWKQERRFLADRLREKFKQLR